jgi:formylglycine-generating enzyme required for sulfatase activity
MLRYAITLFAGSLALAGTALGLEPGETFRDCADCPEMVAIRAGSFTMGSTAAVTKREGIPDKRAARERPRHRVEFARPFAIGKYEVTRGEYAAFVAAADHAGAGCKYWTGDKFEIDKARSWRNPGYKQTDGHPATCISWDDAKAYVAWLSDKTGKRYRLPSEAEWEYVARAGADYARWWGDDASDACNFANVYDMAGGRARPFTAMTAHDCNDGHAATSPVGSYSANHFGVHDTAGNVWEWVEDCWHKTYAGAPSDGGAWTGSGRCGQRVLRGGSWISIARFVRSANRSKIDTELRIYRNGFRVARPLPR